MSADYLSGDAGDVTHPWRRVKRTLGELACDAIDVATLSGRRLDRIARAQPARRVHVVSIYRPGSLLPAALAGLRSARHEVTFALGATGAADAELAELTVASELNGGKFENVDRVLELSPPGRADWMLVVDDDIVLRPRFLDRFLGVCDAVGLELAQPAQTLRSHSAWRVTRRRPASLARETRFVEIGPLTALRAHVAAELVPFPPLRYGWGLDLHWGALAEQRGWRLGVVDATPVRHETATVGSTYSHADAEAEAQRFHATRPYVTAARADETLATHRSVRT